MKQYIRLIPVSMFLFVMLTACGINEPQLTEPDMAATVDAAVAATAQFEAQLETTIAEAVDQAVDTAVDEAFETYAAQTEAELAEMIDEAVDEAVAATESYTTASTNAAADGEITDEELETIYVYVQLADDTLAEVDDLIADYYAQFEELAQTTIDQLAAIEEELDEIAAGIEAMNAILAEISESLAAGLELAQETISQLQTTAMAASESIQGVQAEFETWKQSVQAEMAARTTAVEQIQPTNIAGNQEEAIQQVFNYLETINTAFSDNNLSRSELDKIGQAGSNAAASLNAQGGPLLGFLSTNIDGLTQQLSMGNWQQASLDMNQLRVQLNDRLSGFSLPDGLPGNISPPKRRP